MTDAVFGAFVGGQYQFGMIVVGAEAGFRQRVNDSWSTTPGIGNAPPIGCNAATVFSCQARIGTILQAGPRLGVAYDKFLAYGTGGWASTTLATQAITNATGIPLAQGFAETRGWFAGGGVDWAIPSLTPGFAGVIGVDYKHYDFDTQLHNNGINGRFVSTTADAVTVRFSLKYDPSVLFVRN